MKIGQLGSWTFKDDAVVEAFDGHVRQQLPWYSLVTDLVGHYVRAYLPDDGVVVDLGASTGNVGRSIADAIEARRAALIAIDSSPQMVAAYNAPGFAVLADAADLPWREIGPNVVVAFLVFQFVPCDQRSKLIEEIASSVRPGGAFIVVDRVESQGGYLGLTTSRLTLAAKREAGASADEIIAKELSLLGVQRPLSTSELPGFVEIFRFSDFVGCIKETPPD